MPKLPQETFGLTHELTLRQPPERYQVYRVSHIVTENGETLRLVQPCVVLSAINYIEAIERASRLMCWSVGHGTERVPGAFLIAAPAWEAPAAVRSRYGEGLARRFGVDVSYCLPASES